MTLTGSKARKRRPRAHRVGGYGTSFIGELAQAQPERARLEILEAVDRSRGRMISAACELGIDRRHLQRLCWQLDLWPRVDALRERWRLRLVDAPHYLLLRQPGLTRGSAA